MSAEDGRLAMALDVYLKQPRNNPVCPFSKQGMDILRRMGCDVDADFNLGGRSLCSGGFSGMNGFHDHARKLGSSADSDSDSGHLHSILFKVMFGGAPLPKKQRTQEASFHGGEVSSPTMLLLELHAHASEQDKAKYCSKGRLQGHFKEFPPSHHIPIYGPGGFMLQVVLVYQADAGHLSRTYANAQSVLTSLARCDPSVKSVRFVTKSEWDGWMSRDRRPDWFEKNLLKRVNAFGGVSWTTLAEMKRQADEEDKQRMAEAEANAEHLAEQNAEIMDLRRKLAAKDAENQQLERELKKEEERRAARGTAESVEDLTRRLKVQLQVDAGAVAMKRCGHAYLKQTTLTSEIEDKLQQLRIERSLEQQLQQEYEEKIAKVKASARQQAERVLTDQVQDFEAQKREQAAQTEALRRRLQEQMDQAKDAREKHEAEVRELEKERETYQRDAEGFVPDKDYNEVICELLKSKEAYAVQTEFIINLLEKRGMTDTYVRNFGELSVPGLRQAGLTMDDDFRALTLVSAWQSGLWVKPIKEEDCSSDEHQGQLQAQKDVADETGFDVPFYALWAFKMVGNEWRIREQTEVLQLQPKFEQKMSVPEELPDEERARIKRTEERRRKENTCHADFVKMIRRKMKKKDADGVLHYLLHKFLEYKSQASHAANTYPRLLWDYAENREMEPLERVELLKHLVDTESATTKKE